MEDGRLGRCGDVRSGRWRAAHGHRSDDEQDLALPACQTHAARLEGLAQQARQPTGPLRQHNFKIPPAPQRCYGSTPRTRVHRTQGLGTEKDKLASMSPLYLI